MLQKPFAEDPRIKKGMEWLDTNPPGSKGYVYYLYGLERIGMLYGSHRIGSHDGYDEGARRPIDYRRPTDHGGT